MKGLLWGKEGIRCVKGKAEGLCYFVDGIGADDCFSLHVKERIGEFPKPEREKKTWGWSSKRCRYQRIGLPSSFSAG